jgi:hypothetical protein
MELSLAVLGAKALLENSTIGTVRLAARARGRLTAEGVSFPPPEATAVLSDGRNFF